MAIEVYSYIRAMTQEIRMTLLQGDVTPVASVLATICDRGQTRSRLKMALDL